MYVYVCVFSEPNVVYVDRVAAKLDKLRAGRWWYKAKLGAKTGELTEALPLPPKEGGDTPPTPAPSRPPLTVVTVV